MPGYKLNQLPEPEPCYNIAIELPGFETLQFAAREDRLRSCRLCDLAILRAGTKTGRLARELADRLDPDNHSEVPETLASSRYMRKLRRLVVGAVLKLVDEDQTGRVARYDVIKPGWAVNTRGLRMLDPNQLKGELRADLLRAIKEANLGPPGKLKGFLIAVLHGDFEVCAELWQIHVHIVASGDWIDVLEGLRSQRGYKATDRVNTPVLAHRNLTDLPRALSYLLKRYWPATYQGPVSGQKNPRRSRKHFRVPEPHHSLQLIWIDQWELGELVLKMGVRQGKHGFVLTNP